MPGMATCRSWVCSLLLLLLATAFIANAAVEVDDLADELKQLRDKSPSGVITFNSESQFTKFTAGRKRPYALYVFLTAKQVVSNTQLNIMGLAKEYALAAQAVKSGPEPDSAFFVEAWFEEVPKIFQAVKAQQVPFIFRIASSRKVSLQDLPVDNEDKMSLQTYGHKYPWSAEDILQYFSKTGALRHAAVERPNLLTSPWAPFILGGALAGIFLGGYTVWRSGIIFHPLPWAVLSLAVFWFSVSGGMYNIIRGMPLFIRDANGKLQFFLNSRGGQLGAEGFIMGSGYILFSSAVAMMAYAVPRIRSKMLRGFLSYAMLFAAGFVLQKLFMVFQGKTGYRITSYLLR